MSGHFSRLNYDGCFIKEDTKQSTRPGDYKLYSGQTVNDKSCHATYGPRGNKVGENFEVDQGETLGDRAEIESVLKNIDLPASRCKKDRTLDEKNERLARDLQKSILCNNFLDSSSTRLELPLDHYRGLSTIDYQVEFPITDPLNNVFNGHNDTSLPSEQMNSNDGKSTRLEAKYNYSKQFVSNRVIN